MPTSVTVGHAAKKGIRETKKPEPVYVIPIRWMTRKELEKLYPSRKKK